MFAPLDLIFQRKYKNMEKLNIELCNSCGACFAICPHNAINMKLVNGVYIPLINTFSCTDCKLCENACPSITINYEIKMKNYYLGDLISCYIGYSTDKNIRWNSSSGGLVTTLLLYLFDKKIISGAVVTSDNPSNPFRPFMSLVKNKEDILKAMGSRYCPIEPRFKVKDLINEKGKIAIVGLPCHIWAFRKLEKINKELKKKIFIHIGLFCANSPNIYATMYFLKKIACIDKEDVIKFSYRGRGWPGKITITTRQGSTLTYKFRDWMDFAYYPHFTPIRCVLCYDITNQLADISLGDAWGLAHNNLGISAIITRTRLGHHLIQRLFREGKIAIYKVAPEDISRGQKIEAKVKKALIRTYIWWKIFNQPIPYTTFILEKYSIKDWILNLGYCIWLYISRYNSLRNILFNLTPYLLRLRRLIHRRR